VSSEPDVLRSVKPGEATAWSGSRKEKIFASSWKSLNAFQVLAQLDVTSAQGMDTTIWDVAGEA
jgi:hypothetical protein